MTAPAPLSGGDARTQLAEVLHERLPDSMSRAECNALLDALLPVVARIADERAAEALEQAADALDTRAVELWNAYKSAPPTDPRRASPHTEGESDGWENAGTAVRARAASLRAASRGETG